VKDFLIEGVYHKFNHSKLNFAVDDFVAFSVEMTGVAWPSENDAAGDPFMDDVAPLLDNGTMDVAGSYYYFVIQRVFDSHLVSLMPSHREK
jgi:hypothetical protein